VNYLFLDEAERELYEAVAYYEESSEGLGLEFSREVFATVSRILKFPGAWSPYSNRTRRCLLKRFPYGIVYRVVGDAVVIFAVMQLNRKPGYWKERLK